MEQNVKTLWGLKDVKPYKSKLDSVKTTNDDHIMGVELEIENLNRGLDYYIDHAGSAWSVVEDGSLRPRHEAWEFVSKPMPLSKLIPEIKDLLTDLEITNYNYSDRCSVHVHTNVQEFTQSQVLTLGLVYSVLEDVLFRFVNHYHVDNPEGAYRDTNIYCVPWNQCRLNHKLVEKLFDTTAHIRNWQKYTALNLLPIREKGTVEWRHMPGTCDTEKLTIWLNLIGSITKFAETTSFDDVVSTIKVLNDTSAYQQFFSAVTNDVIPYVPEYQRLLVDGLISAKYMLLDYKGKKEPRKQSRLEEVLAQMADYNDDEEVIPDFLGQVPEPPPEARWTAQAMDAAANVRQDAINQIQEVLRREAVNAGWQEVRAEGNARFGLNDNRVTLRPAPAAVPPVRRTFRERNPR